MLIRFIVAMLAVVAISPLNSYSAIKSEITGRVIDHTEGNALSSASVTIHKLTDSSMVSGKITDKNGSFAFNDLPDDRYYIKVQYVGYEPTFISPVIISQNTQLIEYQNIGLLQSASMTDEITVTAERPLIEYQMGKQVLNVDKTIAANNGNVLDVLKTAPSVEVSAEGQLSLRGSSNVRILIDGKPTPASGTQLANILEQIPAETIDNIELITNPSAKYDAAGMSGIINIILKKKREGGFNGVASLNAGSHDKYSTALSFNYNVGDVNVYANYDHFSHTRLFGQEILRETYLYGGTSFLNQDSRQRSQSVRNGGRLGIEMNLDERNFLSITGGYSNSENKTRGTFDYISSFMNSTTDSNIRKINTGQPMINYDVNASYKLSFDRKGQELTADIFYNEFDLEMSNNNRFYYYNPDGSEKQNPFFQRINSANNVRTLTFQSDYVHPFSQNSKLESGAKAIYRKFDGESEYLNYDYSVEDWMFDTDASNHFLHDETVLSVYALYSGMIDKFSYQFGLRGEQTFSDGDLKTTGETFSKEYFDLFPSAVLSYRFNPSNQLQLSYSQRIDRPQVWLLNPFKDKSDPTAIRTGNPNLKPVYTDSYELGFIKFIGSHMLTPSLFIRKSSDVMTMYTTYNQAEEKIYHTYMNYSDGLSYGLDFNYQARAFAWLTVGANFSYYKNEVTVNHPELPKEDRSDFFWNGRLNGNISFTKYLSMQVFGMYHPQTVTPQGMRHESYWMDFAIRYEFWNNDASLVFRLSNAFDTQKWGGYAKGDGFKFTNTYLPEAQVMNLGFSYKINNGPRQQQRRRTPQQDQAPPSDMF